MKKFFITILLVAMTSICYAQNFLPILKDGRRWHCVKAKMFDKYGVMPDDTFDVTVIGDTIANNRKCKKLNIVFKSGFNENFAAYEEDSKLYTYNGKEKEIAIDMNVHVGDQIPYEQPYIDVAKEDVIEVKGVKRRRITFQEGYKGRREAWVEGIGATTNQCWYTQQPIITSLEYATYYYFDSCYDNDVLIFSKDDFDAPSVESSITKLESKADDNDGKLYDVSGKPINNTEKGKVYILNRRKYVKP